MVTYLLGGGGGGVINNYYGHPSAYYLSLPNLIKRGSRPDRTEKDSLTEKDSSNQLTALRKCSDKASKLSLSKYLYRSVNTILDDNLD